MKKLLLVAMAVALICGCSAPAEAAETGRGVYVTPYKPLTRVLNNNKYLYHSHEYDQFKLKYEYGLGLDVKVYDFRKNSQNKVTQFLDSINIENKYDFNNENFSTYLVLSIDLTPLWQ